KNPLARSVGVYRSGVCVLELFTERGVFEKEEGPILAVVHLRDVHRTADAAAQTMLVQSWPGLSGAIVVPGVGVEKVVAAEIKRGAVQLIRAARRHHTDLHHADSRIRAHVLSRDAEFAQALQVHVVSRVIGEAARLDETVADVDAIL